MSTFKEIAPVELHELVKESTGTTILDVRNPPEYETAHASVAVNLPLSELSSEKMEALGISKSDPVHVICNSGGRSAKACKVLVEEGFTNVVNITGGTKAWLAAGLPAEGSEVHS